MVTRFLRWFANIRSFTSERLNTIEVQYGVRPPARLIGISDCEAAEALCAAYAIPSGLECKIARCFAQGLPRMGDATHYSYNAPNRPSSSWLWKSERNIGGPLRPLRISRPTGRNHDILSAVDHVSAWAWPFRHTGRLPSHRSLPVLGVEGAQLAVIDRRADKQYAASGQNRATVVLRTGVPQPLRHQLGVAGQAKPSRYTYRYSGQLH